MTDPVCPCDGAALVAPVNPPGLSHLAYRIGGYAAFRRALLTPPGGESALAITPPGQTVPVPVWRTDGADDLAVMVTEWFAYIADVLTFYNERIANQDYLRTADLPESVTRLIALLGYRPRPAIGATGVLAALVTPGQSAVLPKGLQFQSKPGPGQAPQTFELMADTPIRAPDRIVAVPPPMLLSLETGGGAFVAATGFSAVAAAFQRTGPVRSMGLTRSTTFRSRHSVGIGGAVAVLGAGQAAGPVYALRVAGALAFNAGEDLVLRPRDPSVGAPMHAAVRGSSVGDLPTGGKATRLRLALEATAPAGLMAAGTSLERPNQSTALWTLYAGAVSGTTVHLASLVRQIRAGDWVLFTSSSPTALLTQLKTVSETIWDANSPAVKDHPVPIPHTVLTLATAWTGSPSDTTVRFDFVSVGVLLDQPYGDWTGTPKTLLAIGAQGFPVLDNAGVLLQDVNGVGLRTTGASNGAAAGDDTVTLGVLDTPIPTLRPPFAVLPNLLQVTRGKTVARETLGGGNAAIPGQSFTLAQSPVTYLRKGTDTVSTIVLTVNGQPWTEVGSFYGRKPDATVFVTAEDETGKTVVSFGDGINGARLPTGTNNVVATYRVGAGAVSPPAGKLTVIAKSFPGLRAVLNPLAVSGGADADPPNQIRRYAPRSVLAFGRAVSAFDYEALAAQAPGVTRARAVWGWNDASQRTVVTVYVGDDAGAVASARGLLKAAGDPNRPVMVTDATPMPVYLGLSLLVTPGRDTEAITAAVTAALTDPETGLFSAWTMGVGRKLFNSQIEAAVLAVSGVHAITQSRFIANNFTNPGPLHDPGEGGFYTLDPATGLNLSLEAAPNGG